MRDFSSPGSSVTFLINSSNNTIIQAIKQIIQVVIVEVTANIY